MQIPSGMIQIVKVMIVTKQDSIQPAQ